MKSIFVDKKNIPTTAQLRKALGSTILLLWQAILDFTCKADPAASGNWYYAGEKYGWSFRISNSKRILVYLLPQDSFFRMSMVFGQKANNAILNCDIDEKIKSGIQRAKEYAEGRGIRVEVNTKSILPDLKEMIRIKISN